MIGIAQRSLTSAQKLKIQSLFSLSQLFAFAQHSLTTTKPKTHPPFPFPFNEPLKFKSFSSSIPSPPFTRDGNYEEPASLVCPGCGFTCRTQILNTPASSSSRPRRIRIIGHIPILFTLLRNRNFQVPSKGVS